MKKLLSALTAVAILASCSNTDELTIENDKTYKVAFNVTGFIVDNGSHGKTGIELPIRGGYFQYAIYKNDGSLLKTNVIAQSNEPEGSFRINEQLPVGNYTAAIMYTYGDTQDRYPIFIPSDLEKDYCTGNRFIVKGTNNERIYYNTVPLVISNKDNDTPIDVVLDPMWSEIDVEITDAETFVLPGEANLIGCFLTPDYAGFGIKDKTACKEKEFSGSGTLDMLCTSENDVRAKGGIFNIIASEGDDVTVKLLYVEHSENVSAKIWNEKVIHQGKIEKGYRYTFTGAIGNNINDRPGHLPFDVDVKSLKE